MKNERISNYVLFDLETTGLSTDKDAVIEISALKDFIAFIGDYDLVGHNIMRFDMKFIQRDAMRFFGKNIENDIIDTFIWSEDICQI